MVAVGTFPAGGECAGPEKSLSEDDSWDVPPQFPLLRNFPLGFLGWENEVEDSGPAFVCTRGGAKYLPVWGGLGQALSYRKNCCHRVKLARWEDPAPDVLTLGRWYVVQTWHWTLHSTTAWLSSFLRTWLSRGLPGSPHAPDIPFGTSGTLRIRFEAFKLFFSNILSHACIFPF